MIDSFLGLDLWQQLGIVGAIASIVALLLNLLGVIPLPFRRRTFTQEGDMEGDLGIHEVAYPEPFRSKPHLTWIERPLRFTMLDQEPDGFRVEIKGTVTGRRPKWKAVGRRTRE